MDIREKTGFVFRIFATLATAPEDQVAQESSTYTYTHMTPIPTLLTAERQGTFPRGAFRTFEVAIQADPLAKPLVVLCIDLQAFSKLCRKGDLVMLIGRLVESDSDFAGPKNRGKQLFIIEGLSILQAAS